MYVHVSRTGRHRPLKNCPACRGSLIGECPVPTSTAVRRLCFALGASKNPRISRLRDSKPFLDFTPCTRFTLTDHDNNDPDSSRSPPPPGPQIVYATTPLLSDPRQLGSEPAHQTCNLPPPPPPPIASHLRACSALAYQLLLRHHPAIGSPTSFSRCRVQSDAAHPDAVALTDVKLAHASCM